MISKLVDIGIDWLTLTTKDPRRYTDWLAAFEFVATQEQARGHKWAKARLLGYEGESCGHAFVGRRDDGAMCRLTSAAAEEYGMQFEPDACHCTRIDLQATARMNEPRPEMIKSLYERAKAHKGSNGRPPLVSRIETNQGGATLYIGARSSMRYGRIYDKGVEMGTEAPGVLLRWEVEIKDTFADQAVAMLCGNTEHDRLLLGILGDFFDSRGCPVPWTVPSLEERFIVPRLALDDANTLKWLAGPVATAFGRIAGTVGIEQALRAVFSKALTESSDSDIIESMALMWAQHLLNLDQGC